jgi:hypothetical protein
VGEFMSLFWKFEQGLREEHPDSENAGLFAGSGSVRLRGSVTGLEIDDATFGLVETREEIRVACALVNERYLSRGYGGNHRILLDAYHATFTTETNGEVVGTITLVTDSHNGLAADRAFQKELDRYRAQPGTKVCELTKFAFNSRIQSQQTMAALFHVVFVYGHRSYGCTDLFIEVNPRHVRFYEAALGFERIGPVKENESVGAPAQLMWLKVARIRERIDAVAGRAGHANQRSLYRLFFSPAEERRIYEQLVAAKAVSAARAPRANGFSADTQLAVPTGSLGSAEQVQRSRPKLLEPVCCV